MTLLVAVFVFHLYLSHVSSITVIVICLPYHYSTVQHGLSDIPRDRQKNSVDPCLRINRGKIHCGDIKGTMKRDKDYNVG